MVFNSIAFLLFFTAFFLIYWLLLAKNLRLQNLFVLAGSYFFYAWADWRFLFLLIGISAFNYFLGIKIEKTENPKTQRWLIYLGLLQGIGGLVYFKYTNFFIGSLNDLFLMMGLNFSLQMLNIIIPIGISFFTFRTLSYILDIEKGKIKATTDWIVFFNYVAFFPSILSGPIDKGRAFIPQLQKNRSFDFDLASDGLRQILWGLFKKMVIANNCAAIANPIFANYENLPSSSLWLGMILYSVQVYADFSGYSDMAIGVSRLLGFEVSKNFDFPFFAQSIAEYWRKWHISLTSWLTEYVFTPLSIFFRDYDKLGLILAIVINFVICGMWHGANWNYILFGLFHGLYFIPSILNGTMNKKIKTNKESLFPTVKEFFNIISTLLLVMFTFVLFKSDTVSMAFGFYSKMFTKSLLAAPAAFPMYVLLLVALFFAIEWLGRSRNYAIEKLFSKSIVLRGMFYFFLITAIFIFSAKEQQFIYFQF